MAFDFGKVLDPAGIFSKKESQDPTKAANQYLNQIPGIGKQYMDPYVQQGQQAQGVLQGQYNQLMNPTSFMDQIMNQYQPSQAYKFQLGDLTGQIGNTAAAGGIAGTPLHQRQQAEMAQNLMSKDMQQYLQNALGIYGTGLQGEQGFYNTGYGASKELMDLLGGALNQQGGLAFNAAQQQQQNKGQMLGTLGSIGGGIVGGIYGGPAGAAVGSKVGGGVGGAVGKNMG